MPATPPWKIRETMLLDAYDIKLLRLLQENGKLSQRQLSEAVNLSPSAVNRRIAALEVSLNVPVEL